MLYFLDEVSDLHSELLGACLNSGALTQAWVKPGLDFISSTTKTILRLKLSVLWWARMQDSMPAGTWPPTTDGGTGTHNLWEQSELRQLDEYMILNVRNTWASSGKCERVHCRRESIYLKPKKEALLREPHLKRSWVGKTSITEQQKFLQNEDKMPLVPCFQKIQ